MSVMSVVRQCVFQNAISSEEHTGQPLTSLTPLTETRACCVGGSSKFLGKLDPNEQITQIGFMTCGP